MLLHLHIIAKGEFSISKHKNTIGKGKKIILESYLLWLSIELLIL